MNNDRAAPMPDAATTRRTTHDATRPDTRRRIERVRVTRETDVRVALDLDATAAEARCSALTTSVPFLDHLLTAFAWHGHFALQVHATGDTQIDDHHTIEDVGLTLGQAFLAALADRRGIVRFASAYAPMDEALARTVVDISGRPFLVYEPGPVNLAARVGTFDPALVEEFWHAFTTEGRLALHLDVLRARNSHHAFEALFKSAALALRAATRRDPLDHEQPTTKGVLG